MVADHEAADHHPVLDDHLMHHVDDGGAGPRNKSFASEEAALTLVSEERLAVVQLTKETHLRAGRLDRVE